MNGKQFRFSDFLCYTLVAEISSFYIISYSGIWISRNLWMHVSMTCFAEHKWGENCMYAVLDGSNF